MNKIFIKIISLLLVTVILLPSCAQNRSFGVTSSSEQHSEISSDSPGTSTPPESSEPPVSSEPPTVDPTPEESRVSLIAVGDNLIHGYLITAGQTFGYDTFYEMMDDVISGADLAIINQESPLTYNSSQYSGYPAFASPTDVAEAAIKAGFDIFTLATNHTWDKGMQPVLDTIDYFKKYPDVVTLGIHETVDDYNQVKIIEKNGIKIALFNYAYRSNEPAKSSFMVEMLTNKTRMKTQFAYARENADFIIVIPHWGKEYVYTPTSSQTSWAKFFADEGADLIIGHHPHVVQPMDTVKGKNGNTTVVFYSLGNFISNQNDFHGNIGGMASVTIVKNENGTYIEKNELIPTTVLAEKIGGVRSYKAMLLSDLTPELLKKNFKFSKKKVQDFYDLFNLASTSYPK